MQFQIRIMTQTAELKPKLATDILKAASLEELVLFSIKARLTLKIIAVGFEDQEKDMIVDLLKKNESIASLAIYGPGLKSIYRYQALPEEMPRFCDKPGILIDEEWLDRRDARLRIKIDPWEGERVAAPTALAELILSYAFASHGIVEITPEIIEVNSGVKDAVRLRLIFLGADLEKEDGWIEVVDIILEKLETLVGKRKVRHLEEAAIKIV